MSKQKWMIEPDDIPELIEYKGWTIWCWTGWKGTKGTVKVDSMSCEVCELPIQIKQKVKFEQGRRPVHWSCAHEPEYLDRHMGQWVAFEGDWSRPNRRMYVNVDNMQVEYIAGGVYKVGESFPISEQGVYITEATSEADKEVAKAMGLLRIKQLVDEVVAADESASESAKDGTHVESV